MSKESWSCRRVSQKNSLPLAVVATDGKTEAIVAKIYSLNGHKEGPSSKKESVAKARADAFILMPEAIAALSAIVDAFPEGKPVNNTKLRQAKVRASRVISKIPSHRKLLEYGGD